MNFDKWHEQQKFSIRKINKEQTIKIKPTNEFLNGLKSHGWHTEYGVYKGYLDGYEYIVW